MPGSSIPRTSWRGDSHRRGDALPSGLRETSAAFAVEGDHTYRINGDEFIVTSVEGKREVTIPGYPTLAIAQGSLAKPLPQTPAAWLKEILLAMQDAREAIPFAAPTGATLAEGNLFQLAPEVAFKFRGLDPSEELRRQVVENALAACVVHENPDPSSDLASLRENSQLAFSLCYLAAHASLGDCHGGPVRRDHGRR